MSPAENIASAKVGDVFKAKGIVANASSAPVQATATAVSQAGAVTFELSYLGIALTKAAVKVQPSGSLTWMEVK